MKTALIVIAVLLLDGSRIRPHVYSCSVIELNHRYNEIGQHCYSQVILWQWDGSSRRHDVSAWWLVEPNHVLQLPQRSGNRWQVFYHDNVGKQWRIVSSVYRETTTTNDPERDNKLLKPEHLREGVK